MSTTMIILYTVWIILLGVVDAFSFAHHKTTTSNAINNQQPKATAAIPKIITKHFTPHFSPPPHITTNNKKTQLQHYSSKNDNNNDEGYDNNDDNDDSLTTVTGVTLKMAFDSSDNWGVADLSEYKNISDRFTSSKSLDLVHRLRRESDCVIVGRNTVQKDNCTLTIRRNIQPKINPINGKEKQPIRVIIDPKLNLLRDEKKECNSNSNATTVYYTLLHDKLQTILYHTIQNENEVRNLSSNVDSSFVKCVYLKSSSSDNNNNSNNNRIDPKDVINDLYTNHNVKHIMVEGGPATAMSFLQSPDVVVDRAIIIKAPFCFYKPLKSNISETLLLNSGLIKLGNTKKKTLEEDDEDDDDDDEELLLFDGDIIEYWSKENIPWPSLSSSEKEGNNNNNNIKDLLKWP